MPPLLTTSPSEGQPLRSTLMRFVSALKASREFWLMHCVGFWVSQLITQCINVFYHQTFTFPLPATLISFIYLTLILLSFRALYWKLHWARRPTFYLLPGLILGSWTVALLWQSLVRIEDWPVIFTALSDMRSDAWRSEEMREFTSMWAYHFYLIFAWLALYSSITADRNQHPKSFCPEFDISNALTRHTVLCSALPLIVFIVFAALCWAELRLAIPSVAVAALVYIPMLYFLAQCSVFIRFDSSFLGSRLLAQLPLLIGLIPALAIIMATAHNALSAIVITIMQPDLIEEAKAMGGQPESSEIASGTYTHVNNQSGMYVGWLSQQLNMIGVVTLVTFIAHYGRQAYRLPAYVSPRNSWFNWHSFSRSTAPSFWLYNIAGWSIFAFYFSLMQLWDINEISTGLNIFITIVSVLSGLLYSPYMRQILKSYSFLDTNPIIFVIKLFLICLAIGLASACILNTSTWLYIFSTSDDVLFLDYVKVAQDQFFFLGYWAFYVSAYFLWCLFYSISVTYRNKKRADIQTLKMEADLKEAQLNTLSGQLDPHFIFNAINNIRALVKEDSERARDALVTLSDILRSSVYKKSQTKTRIADEITLVNNYIALAQIQHEERLRYTHSVTPETLSAFIPPMVLQMLVENAIKHGISHLPDGGDLELHIYTEADSDRSQPAAKKLVCTVSNSGTIRQQHTVEGLGVGVSNIQARIQLLYGSRGEFTLSMQPRANLENTDSNETQWVVAKLSIPYETNLDLKAPATSESS